MWQDILEAQRSPSAPRLSVEDAAILYRDADFNLLRSAAYERRKVMNPGNHVTYMIDRNVNYTNVCTINCQFCSFYRPPDHPETYTQTYEQISARFAELESESRMMYSLLKMDLSYSRQNVRRKSLKSRPLSAPNEGALCGKIFLRRSVAHQRQD